jgi:alkyl sulfatase BDS1-like metallo-beta-lactamase superfamily hydrolase
MSNGMSISDSFEAGSATTGPRGQRAHPLTIEHSDRLVEKLYKVGDKAWSLVGNGLSNQSFVEGPEGLIVIDTGECNEEMAAALAAVRKETDAPIVACIYTHFHYVGGTEALLAENSELPIWGHAGIQANLERFGGEIAPRVTRGLVHQFAIAMPADGPDGVVNLGLGNFFRNPNHAPFTNGYLPAQHTFDAPMQTTIAGLEVEFYPAPSDATDSATIWFPQLKLAVNNLLWPTLFNVFAIRGEEYRDPRILLRGLDELNALGVDHLIGAHGPPMSGTAEIDQRTRDYRDSIQFMWDQTVRCANRGLTLNETIAAIKLPDYFKSHYTTQQLYGVVEHHVRQIYSGLFGWFDEDEANLFPVPGPERLQKLIAGFGGVNAVRQAVDQALVEEDYRWAIELASWLVRCELNEDGRADAGEAEDRLRLATALRGAAYNTTSANVRNWCVTRALELDGSSNLQRFRTHRFQKRELARRPATESLGLLRVLLVPERAGERHQTLTLSFTDGGAAALTIRHGVAVPVVGEALPETALTASISSENWFEIMGGKLALSEAMADGVLETSHAEGLKAFFACFDLVTLNS